eukprot:1984814-Prorocentrum_lima.AAC.1
MVTAAAIGMLILRVLIGGKTSASGYRFNGEHEHRFTNMETAFSRAADEVMEQSAPRWGVRME